MDDLGQEEVKQDIKQTCVDCRKEFTIAVGEQIFYEKKGLSLPKRDKICRKLKKQKNQAQTNA